MFNFDFRLRRRFPELQLRTHEFHEDDCEDGNHQHFGNDCESMTGQASHLHRSTFRKNGVATSRLQAGHFAMGISFGPTVPFFFHRVNGTKGAGLTRNE